MLIILNLFFLFLLLLLIYEHKHSFIIKKLIIIGSHFPLFLVLFQQQVVRGGDVVVLICIQAPHNIVFLVVEVKKQEFGVD